MTYKSIKHIILNENGKKFQQIITNIWITTHYTIINVMDPCLSEDYNILYITHFNFFILVTVCRLFLKRWRWEIMIIILLLFFKIIICFLVFLKFDNLAFVGEGYSGIMDRLKLNSVKIRYKIYELRLVKKSLFKEQHLERTAPSFLWNDWRIHNIHSSSRTLWKFTKFNHLSHFFYHSLKTLNKY